MIKMQRLKLFERNKIQETRIQTNSKLQISKNKLILCQNTI